MPSVTQGDREGHLGFPSKKRCRDEFGSTGAFHGIHNTVVHAATQPALPPDSEDLAALLDENQQPYHRKILPVAKRLRLDDDRRAARPLHDRLPTSAAGAAAPAGDVSSATISTTTSTPASTRLSNTTPCHICHRRPQRRSDLDSLADCEGCGQRTCFVCIRECPGWPGADSVVPADTQHVPAARGMDHPGEGEHTDSNSSSSNTGRQGTTGQKTARLRTTWSHGSSGHRRMICSRCCMERGQDGEVVCLGCLPFVEG